MTRVGTFECFSLLSQKFPGFDDIVNALGYLRADIDPDQKQ